MSNINYENIKDTIIISILFNGWSDATFSLPHSIVDMNGMTFFFLCVCFRVRTLSFLLRHMKSSCTTRRSC